jgi:hypothetical protein
MCGEILGWKRAATHDCGVDCRTTKSCVAEALVATPPHPRPLSREGRGE